MLETKNFSSTEKFLVRGGEQGSRTPSAVKRIVQVSIAGATVARYSPVAAARSLYHNVISIKTKIPSHYVKVFLLVRLCEWSFSN
jgi:hypothetical protein